MLVKSRKNYNIVCCSEEQLYWPFHCRFHGRMSSNQVGGAPNFCPKNLSLQLNIAQKNFQHIIYGNGIKITNFGPQMLIAKVNSLRNKMVLPKNGQINRIALRVAFFKAHFYFSNLLWHIV